MLVNHKIRAYFKREKGMPYNDRGKRVTSARHATSFIEAEIEATFDRSHDIDSATRAIIRDAFMSGRYADAQRMAWEHGAPIRISVTGTAGDVTSPRHALQMSREYYSDIVDQLGGLDEWNAQQGTAYRSEESASMAIWRDERSNGSDYPGLDVHDVVYLGRRTITKPDRYGPGHSVRSRSIERVLVTHSCGQIREEILGAFPELKAICNWHLSDMRVGAPDQEKALKAFYKSDTWKHARADVTREKFLADTGILDSQSDEQILVNGEIRSARGYRYGSAHVAHWIPDEVLRQLHVLAEASEKERAA